jgi:hypothetical protein
MTIIWLIKFSNCLCECYMIILWLYQFILLFIWMLHDKPLALSSSWIVYVYVTWLFYDFINSSIVYVNVTYDNSLALSSSWIVYVNVTWLLYDLSSSQIVYVNVTWLFFGFIKFSNCLCECYMIILWLYQFILLFIWMLHDISLTLSSSQMVYVNIAWLFYDFIKFSNCLCVCYMTILWLYQFFNCLCECYMTILWLYQVLKLFMWMLHMIILWLYQVLELFMWMLHDYSLALSSSRIVYVNVTW